MTRVISRGAVRGIPIVKCPSPQRTVVSRCPASGSAVNVQNLASCRRLRWLCRIAIKSNTYVYVSTCGQLCAPELR
eukprot:2377108-Pyramimonas_sp.AAC.1